jgi:hypothetical protein
MAVDLDKCCQVTKGDTAMSVASISGPGGMPGFSLLSTGRGKPVRIYGTEPGTYNFGKAEQVRQICVLSGKIVVNGKAMSAFMQRGVKVNSDEKLSIEVPGPDDAAFAIHDF